MDETDDKAVGAVIFTVFVLGMGVGVMSVSHPNLLLLSAAALIGAGILGHTIRTFNRTRRPT